MRIILPSVLLLFAGFAATETTAETVTRGTVVYMAPEDGRRNAAPVEPPERAMTMTQVENRYGVPRMKHRTVGDPPITRWDYAGFSVFFEHKQVLHAVIPGDFPRIRHREELQR